MGNFVAIIYKFIFARANNGIRLMLESVAKYFNDHHYFIYVIISEFARISLLSFNVHPRNGRVTLYYLRLHVYVHVITLFM